MKIPGLRDSLVKILQDFNLQVTKALHDVSYERLSQTRTRVQAISRALSSNLNRLKFSLESTRVFFRLTLDNKMLHAGSG